ncbi:DoxX family protein [Coraliomargarita sp. W4R72]
MVFIQIALQVVLALGILNVWCLRYGKLSAYRGGNARNITEEFATYGLPQSAVYVIGAMKISCALALLIGIWLSSLVLPAASLLALLMLGAIAMHLRVKDPLTKSLPAIGMLGMCLILICLV